MSFGIIPKIKALDYSIGYLTQDNNGVFTCDTTKCYYNATFNGLYERYFNTNGNIANTQNYDYLEGYIYAYSEDTILQNNIQLNQINLSLTCNNTDVITSGGNTWGYITYADGTSATILSTLKGVICDSYSGQMNQATSGGTITMKHLDTDINYQMYIRDTNGNGQTCEVNSNGYFKCPLRSTNNYNGFLIKFLNGGTSANIRFGINRSYILTKSGTSSIIQNDNTNTQNIINSQNQINNNIINSNITTTTTDNALDINSSMNSDTSNVVSGFMLIPINFFSTIIQSFQNQCAQVCIGECGGSSGGAHDNAWRFIFPCINLENLVGSNIYGLIDILFAFGMLFAFIRSVKNFLYKALMLTNDAASEVGVFL